MQKITTSLWFDSHAEEAANFYVSVFANSKILETSRYGEGSMGQPGSVMTVDFELFGQRFNAINGGPMFTFSEAISLSVSCADQNEVDDYWNKLTADGGSESQCGWLKDKFGLSWQIVPVQLMELMGDPDPAKSQRVMKAMLGMRKISVPDLQAAWEG
jgi:predicted 3-demethylubiquinone-9 3-methyltransferase (glyoxalase superfamily)